MYYCIQTFYFRKRVSFPATPQLARGTWFGQSSDLSRFQPAVLGSLAPVLTAKGLGGGAEGTAPIRGQQGGLQEGGRSNQRTQYGNSSASCCLCFWSLLTFLLPQEVSRLLLALWILLSLSLPLQRATYYHYPFTLGPTPGVKVPLKA